MKQPDFAKWYFYQLLKDYEGEQLYLNELGYVYGNEEKTNEIVKNNPGYVVKIFEEKMVNELKIRTRMMKILRNGKINIYEYINKEQLEKFSHYMFGVDYAVIMGILEMKGSDRTCRKCESTC